MIVRAALLREAPQVCEVLRRSITELCVSDHGNREEVLAGWLDNKTPEVVGSWIADPDQRVLVAVVDERIAGVGAALRAGEVAQTGEVALNYVSPDFRFRGVSRAILLGLEDYLVAEGNRVAVLTSTATAHRFYLGAGYVDSGEPVPWRGVANVYPMRKDLQEH